MKQTTMFDPPLLSPAQPPREQSGEQLKKLGMARAAKSHNVHLAHAQEVAAQVGRLQGFVTADDVWRFLEAEGWKGDELGNAAGSLWAGDCWRKTGRYIKSARPKMHSTDLPVWEFIENTI